MIWKNKKLILWAGVLIFCLMGLFPPFSFSGDLEGMQYRIAKANLLPPMYGFLLSPPTISASNGLTLSANIDFSVLIIQWLILSVITVALLYTRNNKKTKEDLYE
ncbi:MAG: hypothetical protein WC496_03365 [Phycisphaerae bacterium]|jgi:hypothetical protein